MHETNNKENMLKEVMALNFAITDIGLYLNTHPTDVNAIKLHHEYVEKYKVVSEKYQKLYGPLTLNYASDSCNIWRWVEDPWGAFGLGVKYSK